MHAALKDIVNIDFLAMDSITIRTEVNLVFNGFPLRIVTEDMKTFYAEMFDAVEQVQPEVTDLAVFAVGYNADTGKPQIGWDSYPEGIHLVTALDVCIGAALKMLSAAGIQVEKIFPKHNVPEA